MTAARVPPAPGLRSPASNLALEGFELLGVIAESRSAIVYLATDQALQMPVAIREYLPRELARRDAASRVVPLSPAQVAPFERGLRAFVDEARILARGDHPSLLRVVRLVEANGTAYSVMPHYAGPPLSDVRRSGAAPDEASLRALLGHLLGALEVFHRIGGVHGAVTPDNILLLHDDRPVLLGPRALSPEFAGDRVEALMAYLKPPPEHDGATDEALTGPWTDFHALAEVARFCITGQLSGDAPSAPSRADPEPLGELVQRASNWQAQPYYTASFLDVIDAAASPLPQHRPQSVAQFREWLERGRPSNLSSPARAAAPESPPGTGPLIEPPLAAVPDIDERAASAAASPAPTLQAPSDADLVAERDPPRGDWRPPHVSAASGFDPGARRRRRIGVWSGLALGALVVLLLAGAWVFDQQPVRIDGWAQGLAATAPGAASPIAAPNPVVGAVPSAANDAKVAGGAPAVVAAAPVLVPVRAPTASPAAAAVRSSPATTPSTRPTPRTARAAPQAAQDQSGPRDACAGRTQFATYRCMQTQCGKRKWAGHAQCERLRATDRVD